MSYAELNCVGSNVSTYGKYLLYKVCELEFCFVSLALVCLQCLLLSSYICYFSLFLSLPGQLSESSRVLEGFANEQASLLTSLKNRVQENSLQQVRGGSDNYFCTCSLGCSLVFPISFSLSPCVCELRSSHLLAFEDS